MNPYLTPHEARVIGCLIEKSVITPEQYPLSLNALQNACNQKSSRDPVLELDRNTVQRTVNDLVAKRLVMVEDSGGRVDKYRQRLCNTQFADIKLGPAELAIICLLLLRGPQTPGELKAHSGRLHEFADTAEVEPALDALLQRPEGALVARLAREPRRKDHTYAHLFGGALESAPRDATVEASAAVQPVRSDGETPSRSAERADGGLAALEARVATLEAELAELKRALGSS
jgi:uncharacterized protein YceH (UPF0502 family)